MKKFDSIIAPNPPQDGREWDVQCARCGSSMFWEECENCGGSGFTGHDCGEDCCCCKNPEDNVTCDMCDGTCGIFSCMANPDWCHTNPLPGQEKTERHTCEWFTFQEKIL